MPASVSTVDSDIRAVCELFGGPDGSPLHRYLLQNCESPLQVPYYYLALMRAEELWLSSPRRAPLTTKHVELGYRAILQRSPEDNSVVQHHVENCPDVHHFLGSLLTSTEVRLRMPQLFARAFPFTSRLWHLHIPKTAGSSFFSAALDSDWGYVNTNMLSDSGGDLKQLATAVRLDRDKRGQVIISGHWQLVQHLASIGPFDRVIVFARDPVECAISEFNYAVDVINRRENVHAAEPAEFIERRLDPRSFKKSYENGFFHANLQCSFLAVDGTCEGALRNLAACNAELLPCDTVDQAITRFFPRSSPRRINVSNKHLRSADLSLAMREEIAVKNGQDFLLFQVAQSRHLAACGETTRGQVSAEARRSSSRAA